MKTLNVKNKVLTLSALFFFSVLPMTQSKAEQSAPTSLRIATFNVSMEALNYVPKGEKVTGSELKQALDTQHPQIKNIAEIIQRVAPDIILLNEFDHSSTAQSDVLTFINSYLSVSQHGQTPIKYPYFYTASVNTGEPIPDKSISGENDPKTYGFGLFPGHFGMALLSKYPIDIEKIRTFQRFLWKDMPGALKPISPETGKSFYSDSLWNAMRLSSKSHWDLPIDVNGKTIHVLASHPTPPVFDGPEDRNGKRNHDEIRFWVDYLSPEASGYIYDDKQLKGGLAKNTPFVILGDLNASAVEGDAIDAGIEQLLNHKRVNDPMPASMGGKLHSPDNANGEHHTAYWRMRADYVLTSKYGLEIKDSQVFWPTTEQETFRLIKDRAASSDHRLVWVDLLLH